MSPVERSCPPCGGTGWTPVASSWPELCAACDGIGRCWIDGAPSFGCKMKLSQRKVGEVVELGNGDRGRIMWHAKGTTFVALIGDFSGVEDDQPTSYPSATGVRSVTDPRWHKDDNDHGADRADESDPLRGRT